MKGFWVFLGLVEILMMVEGQMMSLQQLREKVMNAGKQGPDAFGPKPDFLKDVPPSFFDPTGNIPSPDDYEYPPNEASRYLVETYKVEIKDRTKTALRVNGPEDERQLAEAPIAPLAFLYFKQEGAPADVYYIRVMIGKQPFKIFHVKISVEYGRGSGLFKLDGKHDEPQNRNRFVVQQVLGPKEETDRLNRFETNAPLG